MNSDKLDLLTILSSKYDVIGITETWNNQKRDINLNNFNLYETSRKEKEGGGSALFIRNNIISTKFSNFIYKNSNEYEIVCVVTRPNYLPRSVSVLVIVCVYIPPSSTEAIQFKLYKSLCNLYENARQKYVSPGFVIMGDFNKWKYSILFSSTTNLEQIVDFPTFFREAKKSSKLDLMYSNIHNWYNKPLSLPPLKINLTHHVCIKLLPKPVINTKLNQKKKIKYRVYSNHNLLEFANLVDDFNWQPFYDSTCIDFKVEYMNVVFSNAFEVTFPEKEKFVDVNDKLWITKSLKLLISQNKKESKNSAAYIMAKNEIAKQIKRAKSEYNKSLQEKIANKPETIHSVVNKLCLLKQKIPVVEKLALSDNLSVKEMLNKINEHFSAISNRYAPIKDTCIENLNIGDCLHVNEFNVLRSFEKLNVRKSNVPGALPAQFLKFAAIHIVPFYTHVINFSFSQMKVPTEWKKGYITPVPKDINNVSIDSLRPITQTNIYSKIMEEFMFNKIYNQVISKLNGSQYGAIKNSSTAYYLISLYEFVLKSLEKPNTYVILVLLDLSKAFDLVDHNVLIRCLNDIGVCINDVMWIADFLRNRQQCTKNLNLLSKFISISNSTPQGTKVAILLFIIMINDLLTKFCNSKESMRVLMNAFVDDMCIAESVEYSQAPRINDYVNELNIYLSENKMCLNAKKSNVIIIDNSKSKRFSNLNVVINGEEIPKTNVSKLLGVLINEKADWSDHVDSIYIKACRKLFILRKLKCFCFTKLQLKNMYVLHIRSIVEYCCVLWCNSLTVKQTKKLVSVEKRALSIITGIYVCNRNYLNVCKSLNISNLSERWNQLLMNFGLKTLKNDRFKHWLEKYRIIRKDGYSNRYNKNVFNFRAVPSRFERYRRSTIPVLIRILREKY